MSASDKCFYIYKNRIMNKAELEKMFDKQNFYETSYSDGEPYVDFEQVKSYIFGTIIPEVIKELIVKELELREEEENEDRFYGLGYNNCIKIIKQKAKENFGIDL